MRQISSASVTLRFARLLVLTWTWCCCRFNVIYKPTRVTAKLFVLSLSLFASRAGILTILKNELPLFNYMAKCSRLLPLWICCVTWRWWTYKSFLALFLTVNREINAVLSELTVLIANISIICRSWSIIYHQRSRFLSDSISSTCLSHLASQMQENASVIRISFRLIMMMPLFIWYFGILSLFGLLLLIKA